MEMTSQLILDVYATIAQIRSQKEQMDEMLKRLSILVPEMSDEEVFEITYSGLSVCSVLIALGYKIPAEHEVLSKILELEGIKPAPSKPSQWPESMRSKGNLNDSSK